MKIIAQILILISLVTLNESYGQTKTENSFDTNIEMLSAFYNSYLSAWATKPSLEYNVLEKKLNSLVELNCTIKLQNQLQKYWEYDHDLLTDDFGASEESPKSLKVSRDSTQENVYLILYKVKLFPNPNKPELKEISFKVKMDIVNECYKINEVISNID